MKKINLCKLLLLCILLCNVNNIEANETKEKELAYSVVWGTLYNPVDEQCDDTPDITADGTKIDPNIASEYRYVAISQDLLYNIYRQSLVTDSTRFRGKLSFGDTIYIYNEEYPEINGKWIVKDAMNKRHKMAIDFLQTKGDSKLYNNNKLWCGKFHNISIYKYVTKPKVNKIDIIIKNYNLTTSIKSLNQYNQKLKIPNIILNIQKEHFHLNNFIFRKKHKNDAKFKI